MRALLASLLAFAALAGCVSEPAPTPGPAQQGPWFAQFEGCSLHYPNGLAVECGQQDPSPPAPSWRQAVCDRENRVAGNWVATTYWPLEGLFGLAATLQPGHEAVLAYEGPNLRGVLHLTSSGQVGVPIPRDAQAQGLLLIFNQTLALNHNGTQIETRSVWSVFKGGPWVHYVGQGHSFQNESVLGLPFGGNVTTSWFPFQLRGEDFTLSVGRTVHAQVGVNVQVPVPVPCRGP